MPTFTQRVQADSDWGYFSSGLWFPGGGGTNFFSVGGAAIAGMRFLGVAIPQGAIITAASLTWTTPGFGNPGGETTQVYGIAEDNTLGMTSDPTGRPKTSQFVEWDWTAWTTANTAYTSPDLTAVVQEIINRTGWVSGNAMGFLIPATDTSGNFQEFIGYSWNPAAAPLLTITYLVSAHISKTVTYAIDTTKPALTQLLRYSILDQELSPVPFRGLKIAKELHNVKNTKNPNNLRYSSDYDTLKYYLAGKASVTVNESLEANQYTKTIAITHNLGYYPVAIVYGQDMSGMANPQPLGRFQAGSGATRSLFFTITKTQIILILNGFYLTSPSVYTVNFWYKIFKNNLGL